MITNTDKNTDGFVISMSWKWHKYAFFVDVSEDFSCNFVQNIYCGSNYGKSDKKALTIFG